MGKYIPMSLDYLIKSSIDQMCGYLLMDNGLAIKKKKDKGDIERALDCLSRYRCILLAGGLVSNSLQFYEALKKAFDELGEKRAIELVALNSPASFNDLMKNNNRFYVIHDGLNALNLEPKEGYYLVYMDQCLGV